MCKIILDKAKMICDQNALNDRENRIITVAKWPGSLFTVSNPQESKKNLMANNNSVFMLSSMY